MKHRLALLSTLLLAVAFPASASAEQNLVVGFRDGVSASQQTAIATSTGATVTDRINALHVLVVTPPPQSFDVIRLQLAANPFVRYAEPDGVVSAASEDLEPQQYPLPIVGAPLAWRTTMGSPSIVVATIDTGIDYTHPDLVGHVIKGHDFYANDDDAIDEGAHGTHVAGIIGAARDGSGVTGIAPNITLMPVRTMGYNAYGVQSVVAKGVVYATDHGARIINMSLKSDSASVLHDAVKYAVAHQVLPICAGGNDQQPHAMYPAAYSQCLAVAATNAADTKASFSNWGPEMDISAPGDNVLSTWTAHGFSRLSGTSMGTAATSGSAGLLASLGLSMREIRATLIKTATDKGSTGWDPIYGWGRLNTAAAVREAQHVRVGELRQIVHGKVGRCGRTLRTRCAYRVGTSLRVSATVRGVVPFTPSTSVEVERVNSSGNWESFGRQHVELQEGTLSALLTSRLDSGVWRVRLRANGIDPWSYQYFVLR